MVNFDELQSRLFVDIQAMKIKCIFYLKDTLTNAKKEKISFCIGQKPQIRNSFLQVTSDGIVISLVGSSVKEFYLDANEIAFSINGYNGKVYPDDLEVIDLLEICKFVEQHKYTK